MSVDVEDYFQVWALSSRINRADWDGYPCRVEYNVERILEIFADHATPATFFTLGWVARRFPALVRRLVEAGHEVASHGLDHIMVHEQTAEEFRGDVRDTKRLLEDTGGVPVRGYRAASFSIGARTPWAFRVLAEEGYAYSSSIYPIRHDIYGAPDAPRFAHRPPTGNGLIEIPISTVTLFGRNLPCGGGGYFRLLPYTYFRWAIRKVNRAERRPCIFYFHPWEIDPTQPRIADLPLTARFRHYINLAAMEGRLRSLLSDFTWDRLDRIFLDRVEESL